MSLYLEPEQIAARLRRYADEMEVNGGYVAVVGDMRLAAELIYPTV
jgi:hypothetical protein